jgi:hypothetical protein
MLWPLCLLPLDVILRATSLVAEGSPAPALHPPTQNENGATAFGRPVLFLPPLPYLFARK